MRARQAGYWLAFAALVVGLAWVFDLRNKQRSRDRSQAPRPATPAPGRRAPQPHDPEFDAFAKRIVEAGGSVVDVSAPAPRPSPAATRPPEPPPPAPAILMSLAASAIDAWIGKRLADPPRRYTDSGDLLNCRETRRDVTYHGSAATSFSVYIIYECDVRGYDSKKIDDQRGATASGRGAWVRDHWEVGP